MKRLQRLFKIVGIFLLVLVSVAVTAVYLIAEPLLPTPGVITLHNPTPGIGDIFAYAAIEAGDKVLVGAVGDKTGAFDAGSAYLFDGQSGELVMTLHNPTPEAFDYFGRSLAYLSASNTLVISGYHDNTGATNAGSVYLYDGDTGQLLRPIHNPEPGEKDYFGRSVAVMGTNLVVGADGDSSQALHAGAAYLFDTTNGELLLEINNPYPEEGDQFGLVVAPLGNNIVVSSFKDNNGAPDAGAVYVFDGSSGDLLLTIPNPTPEEGDLFGYSAAVVGEDILVGATGDNTGASGAGAAYLFNGETGELLLTIPNPTPEVDDFFGYAVVGLQDNVLAVGAIGDSEGAYSAGSVYLFDGDSGELLQTIHNPTPKVFDVFGWSVAAFGESGLLVGAIGDKGGALSAGAAYVFESLPALALTK